MHHKFCVIDKSIVITGSYNWTNQAKKNHENIMITEGDLELANEFLKIFNQLQQPDTASNNITISSDTLKRRLEMIKNFILLDEIEEISSQVKKLSSVIDQYKLNDIINSIEQGKYQLTVEQITHYLSKFTALVLSEDIEVSELKFELKLLELHVESISNEKIDIERNLLLFNRRQFEILGEVTQKILRVKAKFSKLKAEQINDKKEELEKEAEQAQETYEDYSEDFVEIQQKKVDILTEDQAKDMKKLYRLACNICHPDKVINNNKEQAEKIFIDLTDAYENNDLTRVSKIYQAVKQGDFSQTRASTLNAVDILRSTLSEMRYKVEQYSKELYELKQDPTVVAMYDIGNHENNWIDFFEMKKSVFEEELNIWLEKLDLLKKEGSNDE